MEREEVLELCRARGRPILDIGAGPLALIAARDYACRVTSIDLDQAVLERERKTVEAAGFENEIVFEREDALNLRYPDNSFDVVISYGALHHVPSNARERFASECCRVARERFCVAEYLPSAFPHENEFEAVDPAWLEATLSGLGHLIKHRGKEMVLFICSKNE